jgi:hypothetical protein
MRGGPMPTAEIQPAGVLFVWHGNAQSAADVEGWFQQQIRGLTGYLGQLRPNIDGFNQRLDGFAHDKVAARRTRFRTDREMAAQLSFRVRRRADAEDYQVPLTRRKLTPRPLPTPQAKAAEPEYTLGDAEYEDALAVLERQRNALERSPSVTANLGEEQIRFLLLIGLNAVFEGQAMGEVFNASGKTDILIRVEDNNVFVGECKIWRGEAAFRDAIDQLLSYLTWRDTKGALLLFIRNADVTAVIEKAVTAIEEHPCHVRTIPASARAGRQDFVLHSDGDTHRQLRLAFLPFALGPASKGIP